MRLLTWNINGLRAVLKRKYGTIKALLDDLGADIVCFQETKLTKADFDRDLALLEGWDSYFSINRGRSAYSGTATFCRVSATAPVAAQEGVTGILHKSGEPSGSANDLFETGACHAAATIWERHSREELEHIDSEGRCVVTDHGAFVLFNVYGPAISNEENAAERYAFKLDFYKALDTRMAALRALGRRVILVGDLNISPAPLDSCEPGPLPEFLAREDRAWLRGLLQSNGGPFVDVFRLHHPDRKEAYTCWSQASGARVNNWGTRIDLILAADGASTATAKAGAEKDGMSVCRMFTASDIWPQLNGSDHCPAWADVSCSGTSLPVPAQLPGFSTRNIFTGKQNKLTAWLRAEQQSPAGGRSHQSQEGSSQLSRIRSQSLTSTSGRGAASGTLGGVRKANGKVGKHAKQSGGPVQSSLAAYIGLKPKEASASSSQPAAQQSDPNLERAIAASLASQSEAAQSTDGDAPAQQGYGQHCERQTMQSQASGAGQSHAGSGGCGRSHADTGDGSEPPDLERLVEEDQREAELRREFEEQQCQAALDSSQRQRDAAAAWREIHERMKPPKCAGHKEDCVIRTVKKKGPNFGRLFYVCCRADGPPPLGRCDYFVWASNREVRGSQISKTKSGGAAKQR